VRGIKSDTQEIWNKETCSIYISGYIRCWSKRNGELLSQTKAFADGGEIKNSKFPYQILFNVIPQIDVFTDNGYTKEEMKMVNETKKIMHAPDIKISATTVRVPVLRAHSESISIDLEKPAAPEEIRDLLSASEGIYCSR
jgi:aspartate-semialdehyde dehydrogenase